MTDEVSLTFTASGLKNPQSKDENQEQTQPTVGI